MLKKFVQGLVFGAGFAISLSIIYSIWIIWALPIVLDKATRTIPSSMSHFDDGSSESSHVISEPPALKTTSRFLGSPAMYDGEFEFNRKKLLASGEGAIAGILRADSRPATGVRIRLALNGNVLSQWATTNELGVYTIPVPFGEYRIDGFEIDSKSANVHLGGLINQPQNPLGGGKFIVGPDHVGSGLNLDFVKPIVKIGPKGDVSLSNEIVAKWEPYPGATQYIVQVYENTDTNSFVGNDTLFPWRDRPEVEAPRINLTKSGAVFKEGYYYTINVTAKDARGNIISETPNQYRDRDFRVIK